MKTTDWFNVDLENAAITVTLALCPDCGKVKITSDPCGPDHLAAVVGFSQWVDDNRDREDA